jgi:hypothetical protein
VSFITSILPSVKSEIDHLCLDYQNHFLSRLSFEKLFSVYSEVLTAYKKMLFIFDRFFTKRTESSLAAGVTC